MKEHELRLVEVDGEARMGEPGVDVVPSLRDLGDGRKECGSEGVDASVIDVESEVL